MSMIDTQDFMKSLLSLTAESAMPGTTNARRLASQLNIASRQDTVTKSVTYSTDMKEKVLIEVLCKKLKELGYIVDVNEAPAVSGIRYGTTIDTVNFFFRDLMHVVISAQGTDESVRTIFEWTDTIFSTKFRKVSVAKAIDRDGDLVVKTTNVPHSTQTCSTLPSFYPWLTVMPEEYFDAFMQADEPVLIMYGPPGTGKSSFIRHLLEYTNGNALLAYNRNVVSQPEVIDTFYDDDYEILVYEDLDDQLGNREDGNQLMPTILNGVDGVLKHNRRKKIIFSTNLKSADRIDAALKRLGRCFDIMYFGELTQEQAHTVRADLGLPKKDFSVKDKWSLAEITAKHSDAQQVVNRFGRKAGF